MEAVLRLNLTDALSPLELRELMKLATETQKPIERLLYEAAQSLVKPKPEPQTVAA